MERCVVCMVELADEEALVVPVGRHSLVSGVVVFCQECAREGYELSPYDCEDK